jgi:hypothetical protein
MCALLSACKETSVVLLNILLLLLVLLLLLLQVWSAACVRLLEPSGLDA